MKSKYYITGLLFVFLFVLAVIGIFYGFFKVVQYATNTPINILSSNDNRDLENEIKMYAKKNGFSVSFTYMGDLEIIDELNTNSKKYDAVWISNSLWLYMVEDSHLTSESKSISISPVVMGIKYNKAKSLDLIGKDVTNQDILNLIQDKKVKYIMSSVTGTNDGATSYLGFLNALAGSPEVLTEEMLDDPILLDKLKKLFDGVERVSGEEDFLETMFVNGDTYEAVIASESSLIHINQLLKEKGKEELYFIYPSDGVPINDSTLAFIDHFDGTSKKENYLSLQKYLRSEEGQKRLKKLGRRTWYGGISSEEDKDIFNTKWGIYVDQYLTGTKFPSKKVITKAINVFINELRKPSHTVFCLDVSGSMYGTGISELKNAMNYILSYEEASKEKLQFSKNDKVTILKFASSVSSPITTNNGMDTNNLLNIINNLEASGGTALYTCAMEGIRFLEKEDSKYNKTLILMTDGVSTDRKSSELEKLYKKEYKSTIPIYGIMFGSASSKELTPIADLSNAKVFDGRENLLKAFKEVRGYN